MTKKVRLINPRADYRPQPPLGLAYIAALERAGYAVRIYDPTRGRDDAAFEALFREFAPGGTSIPSGRATCWTRASCSTC